MDVPMVYMEEEEVEVVEEVETMEATEVTGTSNGAVINMIGSLSAHLSKKRPPGTLTALPMLPGRTVVGTGI